MLIVPIEEARSGMKLAAPVLHPDSVEQELLRAGYVLEEPVLARLSAMGVPVLYVDYPDLSALDAHLAAYLSPARQAVYCQIKQAIADVQRQTRPAIAYAAYCAATRELVQTLLTQGKHPVYLEQMARRNVDAVAHAAAVSHLSLMLGLKLETYLINERSRLPPMLARDVVNLGVAGMLHDLGLASLPAALAAHIGPEPPEEPDERKQWQLHPRVAYETVRGEIAPSAAGAVLQHHQHFDGSGFPPVRSTDGLGPLSGHRIHVFARILFCADLYDRLATSPPGERRRNNMEILHLMRTKYAGWCDPQIVRVLESVAPPYPPGSRVRLSDGTSAVVIDIGNGKPTQPVVRRLGEDRWTLVGEPLDLSRPGAPAIVADATPAN